MKEHGLKWFAAEYILRVKSNKEQGLSFAPYCCTSLCKFMKAYSIFTLFILVGVFFSCSERRNNDIIIDLRQRQAVITYSMFVDSIKNVTLKSKENLFISNIERLYIDDEYVFIEDKKVGIFVFSLKEKRLLRVIDFFGQGPGEFVDIMSSTIDRNKKQILIFSYPSLYKYTYTGEFIEKTEEESDFFRDFSVLPNGEFICIYPVAHEKYPSGVWLADRNLQMIKPLKEIPKTEMLQTISMYYNLTDQGIYYYDRVWDDFSYITRDSVKKLYSFDFKQRIPSDARKTQDPPNRELYASIASFAYSPQFILLNYFWFNRDPITWVLLDRKKNKTFVSNVLYNDMNETETSSNSLYYVDDYTWCRVLDFEEDCSDVKLEFLYVKR